MIFFPGMFLPLLIFFLATVGQAKRGMPVFGSGDLVTASAASSSSQSGYAGKDDSNFLSSHVAKKGWLKNFSRGAKKMHKQASLSDGADALAGSTLQTAPFKSSRIARNRKSAKKRGISKIGINTDVFLVEFNLQNLLLSILSGGGVYIGYRIAGFLESVYYRYITKDSKQKTKEVAQLSKNGKNRGEAVPEDNAKMYNQLKIEQEELWRITHQLYSEVDKIRATSNSTRVELVGVLEKLAEVQTSSFSPPSEEGAGGISDDMMLMRKEINDNAEKVKEVEEVLKMLKGEDIPNLLKAKERAIVEKVASYVQELKDLVSKKQKSSAGRRLSDKNLSGTTSPKK